MDVGWCTSNISWVVRPFCLSVVADFDLHRRLAGWKARQKNLLGVPGTWAGAAKFRWVDPRTRIHFPLVQACRSTCQCAHAGPLRRERVQSRQVAKYLYSGLRTVCDSTKTGPRVARWRQCRTLDFFFGRSVLGLGGLGDQQTRSASGVQRPGQTKVAGATVGLFGG